MNNLTMRKLIQMKPAILRGLRFCIGLKPCLNNFNYICYNLQFPIFVGLLLFLWPFFSNLDSHQLTFSDILNMLFICLAVFEPYMDPKVDTLAPKLLFIALNLAAMALGVWKVKFDHLNYIVMKNVAMSLQNLIYDSLAAELIGSSPYTRFRLGIFTAYCSGTLLPNCF